MRPQVFSINLFTLLIALLCVVGKPLPRIAENANTSVPSQLDLALSTDSSVVSAGPNVQYERNDPLSPSSQIVPRGVNPYAPMPRCYHVHQGFYQSVVIANLWTGVWDNKKKHEGSVSNHEAIQLLRKEENGCGAITSWKEIRGSSGDVDMVTFDLPETMKGGCIGRAFRSASGMFDMDCPDHHNVAGILGVATLGVALAAAVVTAGTSLAGAIPAAGAAGAEGGAAGGAAGIEAGTVGLGTAELAETGAVEALGVSEVGAGTTGALETGEVATGVTEAVEGAGEAGIGTIEAGEGVEAAADSAAEGADAGLGASSSSGQATADTAEVSAESETISDISEMSSQSDADSLVDEPQGWDWRWPSSDTLGPHADSLPSSEISPKTTLDTPEMSSPETSWKTSSDTSDIYGTPQDRPGESLDTARAAPGTQENPTNLQEMPFDYEELIVRARGSEAGTLDTNSGVKRSPEKAAKPSEVERYRGVLIVGTEIDRAPAGMAYGANIKGAIVLGTRQELRAYIDSLLMH